MDSLATLKARLAAENTRYAAWIKEVDRQRDSILEQRYGTSQWHDFYNKYGNTNMWDEVQREAMRVVGEGTLAEVDAFLNELCAFYLVTTTEMRHNIRDALARNRDILAYMLGYIGRAEKQLATTKDSEWLRRALAAASMENARVDYRDLTLALGELSRTAMEAGIDPFPIFQEVATLSSEGDEETTFPGSMQEFLSSFKPITQKSKRRKR